MVLQTLGKSLDEARQLIVLVKEKLKEYERLDTKDVAERVLKAAANGRKFKGAKSFKGIKGNKGFGARKKEGFKRSALTAARWAT
uniref:Uncharacterized protein n=1 Tax=Peronospora matthiolae TaxID=2874970 RepID=A0AAV1V1V3_9STRA